MNRLCSGITVDGDRCRCPFMTWQHNDRFYCRHHKVPGAKLLSAKNEDWFSDDDEESDSIDDEYESDFIVSDEHVSYEDEYSSEDEFGKKTKKRRHEELDVEVDDQLMSDDEIIDEEIIDKTPLPTNPPKIQKVEKKTVVPVFDTFTIFAKYVKEAEREQKEMRSIVIDLTD
ncbi:hypothetical protein QKU48_gp0823 [Fadolivirus algeromassiliense]|uniref:Uncharacterized protein n=1 Tax=Fadolivirus FV1/VV64 TaxID=3070911 RepID=A0A7D3R1C9_9VIRU|nr:hypothetical protein QKU48_gp0823 [Fadolivirus algeromassiliense]QKF94281.1 hypothetical protein Fadolivirus_1_823 [Fadolivirus FV1/VV64]